MLGQENVIVKQYLIKELKQLQSKQTMIQFYINYDFPQKQRALKTWWQDFIQNIIRKKNQIYVTFQDLQFISTIHNMKPCPLKSILRQLKKQQALLKQEDIMIQKKEQQKKPWYVNIMSFAWNNKDKVQHPFVYQLSEKIISLKIKERKKKQLINFMHQNFKGQSSKFMRDFLKEASWGIKIDEVSIKLLLYDLKKEKQIFLTQANQFGDNIVIFCLDRKKMSDENFLKIQKIKCLLKVNHQKLEGYYDKSSSKIANLKIKAKDALLEDDKNKAKVILARVKKEQEHRVNIDLRKQVLEQKTTQIQLNQMNKSSIDLLKDAQKVYQEIAVDSEKFDEVMQKSREIQMESEQANKNFTQLANSDQIADQVDDLLKQLNQEVVQKKKVEIQRKNVNVQISNKKNEISNQKMQIDRPYYIS